MKTSTQPPVTTQSSTAHSHPIVGATTGFVGKQIPATSAPATAGIANATLPRIVAPRMVKLAEIRIDGGTQTRAEINDDTVAQYLDAMLAGAQFPAIILYDDGEVLWLADGFHRYRAADTAGRLEILAEVRPGSRIDAIEHALKANNSHGLRRTNADKRRCVQIALQHFSTRSDRVLAELCGVGNQLVGEIRELCDSHSSKVRVGKGGKTRKNPVHRVKVAQNKPEEIKNQPGGLLPTTPEKPAADVPTEHILPPTVTVPEPENGLDSEAKEQPAVPAPAGEKYKVADGSSANLPTEGFLTVAHLTRGLGQLKLVAKLLDGGKVSSALVGKLERGFLTIIAAVFEIAGADADQADKNSVVEILRSVANTIETAS